MVVCPAVCLQPNEDKAMDFESPGELGTGEEAQGAEHLEQEVQRVRLG
jgi:hypothetical protein